MGRVQDGCPGGAAEHDWSVTGGVVRCTRCGQEPPVRLRARIVSDLLGRAVSESIDRVRDELSRRDQP